MTTHTPPSSDADMTTSYTSRIGLLTDIHWETETEDEIRTALTTAIDHFDQANVDRIVVLGDLISEGETATETRSLFKRVIDEIRGQTDRPVTVLRGNHDVISDDGSRIRDLSIESEHGTFELTDSITGIYLDTSSPEYPDARGKLGHEEREYLDEQLGNADYAVVFTHHPLYYHDFNSRNHFTEHPEAAFASDKYLANEIFAEHGNVIAALNGHTHMSDHTIYQDVPYFTINAFNNERPGFEDVNGSFAVLEVSQSKVKRLSHQHGTYTDTATVHYPAGNQLVAFGGTFGPIHDGHRQMFQRAFEVGDVMVGLTSDELAQQTRHTERTVPSFEDRFNQLTNELEDLANLYGRSFEVRELTDPMGYVTEDPSFTHLIVSPETFSRGETVNEKRLANSLEPLTLEVVDPVLADDGKRISSTRIVNGTIDEHGNITE